MPAAAARRLDTARSVDETELDRLRGRKLEEASGPLAALVIALPPSPNGAGAAVEKLDDDEEAGGGGTGGGLRLLASGTLTPEEDRD